MELRFRKINLIKIRYKQVRNQTQIILCPGTKIILLHCTLKFNVTKINLLTIVKNMEDKVDEN